MRSRGCRSIDLRRTVMAVIILAALVFTLVRVQVVQSAKHNPGGIPSAEAAADKAPVGATPLLVDVFTVQEHEIRLDNTISGSVEPYRTATIAAEVAERIIRRPVQRGDHVNSGDLLATLYGETAASALSQANHMREQAIAARLQAETDYQRALVETDAGRQQAKAQVEQALADLDSARARESQATAGERKAFAYTRRQEQRQADEALNQACVDEKLAGIERGRQETLYRQGATARDALDRAQATYDSAVARRKSTEQASSLAKEGARQEDRDTATAQVAAAAGQVSAAQHQVEQARAALRTAETRDTRLAALRRQIDGLRAQERESADGVRQAQIALEKRTIRAPFAGRVLATMADIGDMPGPGAPIVRLGEVVRVKVTFAVPEASRPALMKNCRLTITADAIPGRSFSGQITSVGYQADPASRTYPIEITVENSGETLLPGMVARVSIPDPVGSNRLSIPVAAVAGEAGGKACVYVIEQSIAHKREVTLGAPGGDFVEILTDLRAGERIAMAPQRLSEGAAVKLRTAGPSSSQKVD